MPQLYHTVRYLRPSQIIGQIRHRVKKQFENPERFRSLSAPPFPGCKWQPISPFLPSGSQGNPVSAVLSGTMTFLNQSQSINWMPDWERAGVPKLWLYNLHYFDWLWAFSRDESAPSPDAGFDHARSVALHWIEYHDLMKGRVGWEPYPVSLRLMNWCAFFFGHYRHLTLADQPFCNLLWESIYRQTEWLGSHLEYHLLGNHLLENAAALSLAGSCFEGPDAERWLRVGAKLLREQSHEQILDDGLHFERSPMYHTRVAYLFLMLYNTGDKQLQGLIAPYLPGIIKALNVLCHPDGRIALLNDSAMGIYSEPQDLFEYADKLGLQDCRRPRNERDAWSLSSAGYFGFREDDGTYIVCDAGNIGPDYIPGHAHADTFSFELSLRGHRVIVDSGVYDYEWSELRRYCRSTAAHNTVEIQGQNQSEVWGAFRVARRAYVHEVRWTPRNDGFDLIASHDGYTRLAGKPVHRRSFTYQAGGFLTFADRVDAAKPVTCRSYLHLHPECSCGLLDERTASVSYPGGRFQVSFSGPGKLDLEEGIYCPEFTIKRKNKNLVFMWSSRSSPEITCTIQPQT